MTTFLHVADHPKSIDVLLALRDGRDWSAVGMTPEPNGLEVDWDMLLGSYLSSTEKTTIQLVRAVYPVEGHGGVPDRVHDALRSLLELFETKYDGNGVTEETGTPTREMCQCGHPKYAHQLRMTVYERDHCVAHGVGEGYTWRCQCRSFLPVEDTQEAPR